MFGSYLITTVRGVPIRLHFTTLLMLFLLRDLGIIMALLVSILLLFSVALHELGHTVVSQKYGIPVQDILLTPIGGVARLRGLPEDPHHEIRIALAGPYVSLVLAVVSYMLFVLTFGMNIDLLSQILVWLTGINTALFCFNLLPSFPMDGGRVLRGWLSTRKGALEATRIASQLGKYMAILFIVIGLMTPGRLTLALIGVFILMAAKSEYNMMRMKAFQQEAFGTGGLQGDAGFEASPPPYEKPKTGMPGGFFGDLLITAKDLATETCRTCFRS